MNTRAGHGRTGPFTDRTTHDRTAGERRRALRWRRLALTATVAAVAPWLVTGARSDSGRVSREFAFTGARAQYVVPLGVCRIRVEAAGGSGGLQGAAGTPGLGARVTATLRVSPDETLLVYVGGQGGTAAGATPGRGGWNGGGDGGSALSRTDGRRGRAGSGGGGATDVRRGEGRLEDRVLVAGGGAGGGGGGIGGPYGTGGGEGGSPTGHDGFAPFGSANPVTGGRGGTPSVGGAPGTNSPDSAVTATGGSLGAGGLGASGGVNGGGGGGGGLYGGGGGGTEFQWTTTPLGAAHGGGGSSFGPSTTRFRNGIWGNLGGGSLAISYDLAADSCAEQDIERSSSTPSGTSATAHAALGENAATFVVFDRSASGSGSRSPANPRSAAPTLGPAPAGISDFVSAFAFDPRAPETVYAATSGYGADHGGRVYKTTDAGKRWRSTTLDWTRVDALAADPQHPDTLYAGTGTAVFKTVNGGRSWQGASRGLFRGPPHIGPAPASRRREGWVTALAVDPSNSDTVYAGTPTGIRKSTDAGRSWTTVLRPGKNILGSAFVITPTSPHVVYVAASIIGPARCRRHTCRGSNWLYTSMNGGTTWRPTRLPLTTAGSAIILAADPLQPTTLYLAQGQHVLTSTDAGTSWRSIVAGTPKRGVSSLLVDPRRSGTAYLVEGLHGDVLKTTDGGHTWTHTSLLGSGALIVALDPARPNTIYAAIDRNHRNRILKSNNGGHTWATAP